MLFTFKMWVTRTFILGLTRTLQKHENWPNRIGYKIITIGRQVQRLSFLTAQWRRNFISDYHRDAHALGKMVARTPFATKDFPKVRDHCLNQINNSKARLLYRGMHTNRTAFEIEYQGVKVYVIYDAKGDLIVTFLTKEMVQRSIARKSKQRKVYAQPSRASRQWSR